MKSSCEFAETGLSYGLDQGIHGLACQVASQVLVYFQPMSHDRHNRKHRFRLASFPLDMPTFSIYTVTR